MRGYTHTYTRNNPDISQPSNHISHTSHTSNLTPQLTHPTHLTHTTHPNTQHPHTHTPHLTTVCHLLMLYANLFAISDKCAHSYYWLLHITYISVDGVWSEWKAWTTCSTTCGNGQKERSRSCNNPAPSLHGEKCKGVDTESTGCKVAKCPGK